MGHGAHEVRTMLHATIIRCTMGYKKCQAVCVWPKESRDGMSECEPCSIESWAKQDPPYTVFGPGLGS